MIADKLTPNELAKLELWSQMEAAFYDGVRDRDKDHLTGGQVTEREEDETFRHLNRHMASLRKQWGMDKIFNKVGWDRA